ncbi:MAG: bile acid:sodium symporter [Bacillota bacterium]|nr:bile acid:sodium symporter [Bacillota bacterium]
MLKAFFKKNQFLIMITVVIAFAFLIPQPGLYIKKIGLLSVFTFIAMFISGLSLSFSDIKKNFKDFKSIPFTILVTFVVFPAISYVLSRIIFTGSYDIFVGIMILATQASTVSSAIVLTMAAKGNVPLAIILTLINNSLSVFVTPVILNFMFSEGNKVSFNVLSMILNLVVVIIVPIVLAQLCKMYLKKVVAGINPWRKTIANGVVLTFVLIGASTASSQIMSRLDKIFLILIFVVLLHTIMLAIAFAYSRLMKLPAGNVSSVLFCSSEKTMTTSILIWGNYFSQYAIVPIVIVSYHLVQIIMDSVVAGILSKKNDS